MANSRDRQILNSIINPLLPIGEGVYDHEEECFGANVDTDILDTDDSRRSKKYEKEGVESAEKGNIAEAISLFGYGQYLFTLNRLIPYYVQPKFNIKC